MSAASSDSPRSMTIGEVLDLLRPDFDDVSISKIRFLESEGLITPQRAPSGYRRFTEEDVDRLRLVLMAQRDQYLPLRVIKDRLDAGELQSGAETDSHPQPQVELVPPPVESPGRSPDIDPHASFNLREVSQQSGLPIEDVRELVGYGVLPPDAADRFSGAQVLLCRSYAVLRSHGVDERHMRQIKNGASRDASLIGQAVGHMHSDERAAAVAEMINALTDAHYWLVMADLNRSTPAGERRPRRTRR